jgi:hypothetical protein
VLPHATAGQLHPVGILPFVLWATTWCFCLYIVCLLLENTLAPRHGIDRRNHDISDMVAEDMTPEQKPDTRSRTRSVSGWVGARREIKDFKGRLAVTEGNAFLEYQD